MNIPDDILDLICDFTGNIEIETKKYKRKSLNNKMKITKITYTCKDCPVKYVGKNVDRYYALFNSRCICCYREWRKKQRKKLIFEFP